MNETIKSFTVLKSSSVINDLIQYALSGKTIPVGATIDGKEISHYGVLKIKSVNADSIEFKVLPGIHIEHLNKE